MHQLQLKAHGEPSDVVELTALDEPTLGDEDVLVSMEAAPINPSDFMLVRGTYRVRPNLPSPLGSEGVGRVVQTGSKVDPALRDQRVLIIPNNEQGTWADRVVLPVRNVVPLSHETDPIQLSMIGINGVTAYLLLNRYVGLMPGDWIGQTAGNSAMGQCIIKLARLAGVKTLSVVRRPEAAEQVRQFGGDRVVLQDDDLHRNIDEALAGKKLTLVLDAIGGTPVGELASWLKPGGSVVSYGVQDGQFPGLSPYELIFRSLSLHGFSVSNWMHKAPREEMHEIYLRLGDLVAEGSLAVAVDGVYPLENFTEAFAQSVSGDRKGKTIFKLNAQ
jgi:NADPH:quinone reductase-like Zn-dependent oxidoreductase